jgi:uncharacterized membrane protein HdeD (DUF308 family)
MTMAQHHSKDALVWGFVLIAIGAIFLLENFGIRVWDTSWKLWPLILIIWGALKLFRGIQEHKEKPADKPAFRAPQDGR